MSQSRPQNLPQWDDPASENNNSLADQIRNDLDEIRLDASQSLGQLANSVEDDIGLQMSNADLEYRGDLRVGVGKHLEAKVWNPQTGKEEWKSLEHLEGKVSGIPEKVETESESARQIRELSTSVELLQTGDVIDSWASISIAEKKLDAVVVEELSENEEKQCNALQMRVRSARAKRVIADKVAEELPYLDFDFDDDDWVHMEGNNTIEVNDGTFSDTVLLTTSKIGKWFKSDSRLDKSTDIRRKSGETRGVMKIALEVLKKNKGFFESGEMKGLRYEDIKIPGALGAFPNPEAGKQHLRQVVKFLQPGDRVDDVTVLSQIEQSFAQVQEQFPSLNGDPEFNHWESQLYRAKEKRDLCEGVRDKLNDLTIDWDDKNWIKKTDTEIRYDYPGIGTDVLYDFSSDDVPGDFDLEESFTILQANKEYLRDGKVSRLEVFDQEAEPEMHTVEEVVFGSSDPDKRSWSEWSDARKSAAKEAREMESDGSDFEDQISGDRLPSHLAYGEFMLAMMEDFDDMGGGEREEHLALSGIEAFEDNLQELKRMIVSLESARDANPDEFEEKNVRLLNELKSSYGQECIIMTRITGNVGRGFEENDDFRDIEMSGRYAAEAVKYATRYEDAFAQSEAWLKTMTDNIGIADGTKQAYNAVSSALRNALSEKAAEDLDIEGNEKHQEKLRERKLDIARLFTGRGEFNTDNDLEDSEFAATQCMEAMDYPKLALAYAREQKIKPEAFIAEIQSEKNQVQSSIAILKDKIAQGGGNPSALDEQISDINGVDLATAPFEKLQEVYMRVRTLRAVIDDDPVSQADMEAKMASLTQDYVNQAHAKFWKFLDDGGFGYGAASISQIEQATGSSLSEQQKEAFKLLSDIKGFGAFDLSDAGVKMMGTVLKVAVIIVATVAAVLFPVLGPALLATAAPGLAAFATAVTATVGSFAAYGGATGLALTALDTAVNNRGFDSVGAGVGHFAKGTAINTATMLTMGYGQLAGRSLMIYLQSGKAGIRQTAAAFAGRSVSSTTEAFKILGKAASSGRTLSTLAQIEGASARHFVAGVATELVVDGSMGVVILSAAHLAETGELKLSTIRDIATNPVMLTMMLTMGVGFNVPAAWKHLRGTKQAGQMQDLLGQMHTRIQDISSAPPNGMTPQQWRAVLEDFSAGDASVSVRGFVEATEGLSGTPQVLSALRQIKQLRNQFQTEASQLFMVAGAATLRHKTERAEQQLKQLQQDKAGATNAPNATPLDRARNRMRRSRDDLDEKRLERKIARLKKREKELLGNQRTNKTNEAIETALQGKRELHAGNQAKKLLKKRSNIDENIAKKEALLKQKQKARAEREGPEDLVADQLDAEIARLQRQLQRLRQNQQQIEQQLVRNLDSITDQAKRQKFMEQHCCFPADHPIQREVVQPLLNIKQRINQCRNVDDIAALRAELDALRHNWDVAMNGGNPQLRKALEDLQLENSALMRLDDTVAALINGRANQLRFADTPHVQSLADDIDALSFRIRDGSVDNPVEEAFRLRRQLGEMTNVSPAHRKLLQNRITRLTQRATRAELNPEHQRRVIERAYDGLVRLRYHLETGNSPQIAKAVEGLEKLCNYLARLELGEAGKKLIAQIRALCAKLRRKQPVDGEEVTEIALKTKRLRDRIPTLKQIREGFANFRKMTREAWNARFGNPFEMVMGFSRNFQIAGGMNQGPWGGIRFRNSAFAVRFDSTSRKFATAFHNPACRNDIGDGAVSTWTRMAGSPNTSKSGFARFREAVSNMMPGPDSKIAQRWQRLIDGTKKLDGDQLRDYLARKSKEFGDLMDDLQRHWDETYGASKSLRDDLDDLINRARGASGNALEGLKKQVLDRLQQLRELQIQCPKCLQRAELAQLRDGLFAKLKSIWPDIQMPQVRKPSFSLPKFRRPSTPQWAKNFGDRVRNWRKPLSEKYPDAHSRRTHQEGGLRFMYRLLFDEGAQDQAVIINTGGVYFRYQFKPHHKTFEDGLTYLGGGKNTDDYRNLTELARRFDLDRAFQTRGVARPPVTGPRSWPNNAREWFRNLRRSKREKLQSQLDDCRVRIGELEKSQRRIANDNPNDFEWGFTTTDPIMRIPMVRSKIKYKNPRAVAVFSDLGDEITSLRQQQAALRSQLDELPEATQSGWRIRMPRLRMPRWRRQPEPTNIYPNEGHIAKQLGELQQGDVIISKSGTRRQVNSIDPDGTIVFVKRPSGGGIPADSEKTILNRVDRVDDQVDTINIRDLVRAPGSVARIERRGVPIEYKPNLREGMEDLYVVRKSGEVEGGFRLVKNKGNGRYELQKTLEDGRTLTKGNVREDRIFTKAQMELLDDALGVQQAESLRGLNRLLRQSELSLPESSYKSLFEQPIAQQNVGNCYLIAALNTMKRSPYFKFLVRSGVREVKRGVWEVSIPLDGGASAQTIRVVAADLKPVTYKGKEYHPLKGGKGYQILEAAYTKKLLADAHNQKPANANNQLDPNKLRPKDMGPARAHSEGGQMSVPIADLGGRNFDPILIIGNTSTQPLSRYQTVQMRTRAFLDGFNNQNQLATAGSISGGGHDKSYLAFSHPGGEQIKIYHNHGYEIKSVNKFDQTVTLLNPWNTSKKSGGQLITLKYDEFMRVFADIQGANVNHGAIQDSMRQAAMRR